MTYLKLTTAALLALSVSACGAIGTASRNIPTSVTALGGEQQIVQRDYRVRDISFSVPQDLKISEGNGFYPTSDIVWRGDPVGDRGAQIGAMFAEAINRNKQTLQGNVPVVVDFDLVRFHGVTERTRYSVGGVYNIIFNMTVRHAETGAVLENRRRVVANLPAPGGTAAIVAEQRGQTEKVRVTDFLTEVLFEELSSQGTL